jgi:hypothetical protein
MATAQTLNVGTLQLSGDAATPAALNKLIVDFQNNALLATGITMPVLNTPGFAKGCLFIDTDIAAAGLYCNKGTNLLCNFTLVTQL